MTVPGVSRLNGRSRVGRQAPLLAEALRAVERHPATAGETRVVPRSFYAPDRKVGGAFTA